MEHVTLEQKLNVTTRAILRANVENSNQNTVLFCRIINEPERKEGKREKEGNKEKYIRIICA